VVASRVRLRMQTADESSSARNQDADMLVVLAAALFESFYVVELGPEACDRAEHSKSYADQFDDQRSPADIVRPQTGYHSKVVHWQYLSLRAAHEKSVGNDAECLAEWIQLRGSVQGARA